MSKLESNKKYAVYQIKCMINGSTYTGCTKNYNYRKFRHLYELKKGVHHSEKMQKDFDIYGIGVFKFRVVKWFSCENEAKNYECVPIESAMNKNKRIYNYGIPISNHQMH